MLRTEILVGNSVVGILGVELNYNAGKCHGKHGPWHVAYNFLPSGLCGCVTKSLF